MPATSNLASRCTFLNVIVFFLNACAPPSCTLGRQGGQLQFEISVTHDPHRKAKRRRLAHLQQQLKRDFQESVADHWHSQDKRCVDIGIRWGQQHYQNGMRTILKDRAAQRAALNKTVAQKSFDSTLGYPGEGPPKRQQKIEEAELDLLTDLAFARKSFKQVSKDARTFSYNGTELQRLVFTNPRRGLTDRLIDLTGISKESLTFIEVRAGEGTTSQPFALLSDHIEQQYVRDPTYFDIGLQVGVPNFLNSDEYKTHPMVQLTAGTDTVVIPISLYGDGVVVTEAPLEDSIYVVFIAFLHNDTSELSLPMNKHVYTVYRKTEESKKTFDDVCKVLVWELLALQHGRKPLLGQEGKPYHEQCHGEYLCGGWGRKARFCLMQFKGDGAFLSEALGVRAHNSLLWMCPWCSAGRDGVNSWKDFSLRAAWMLTIRTQESGRDSICFYLLFVTLSWAVCVGVGGTLICLLFLYCLCFRATPQHKSQTKRTLAIASGSFSTLQASVF